LIIWQWLTFLGHPVVESVELVIGRSRVRVSPSAGYGPGKATYRHVLYVWSRTNDGVWKSFIHRSDRSI